MTPTPESLPSALPPAYPARAAWGTAAKLRAWQTEAVTQYFATEPRDYLAVATPGAGKTTFALTVAAELLAQRKVERVTVVAPTEHLKTQWAEAAGRAGVPLDPAYSGGKGRTSKDYLGIAVTYAGVAANPLPCGSAPSASRRWSSSTRSITRAMRCRGVRPSGRLSTRRTGGSRSRARRSGPTSTRSRSCSTPRTTTASRAASPTTPTAMPHALSDHVVRPVLFLAYSGQMQWRTRAGDEVAARLGEPLTKDLTAQALRTALDPHGAWMPSVLAAADTRLTEVRRHVPDAGGLVIASDQESARAYAKLLQTATGHKPVLVLSDEKAASKRIAAFSDGDDRWMVAVRMVSEGVDVPRLAVGVYATTTTTPLFFAQAVGRFVRASARGETASVFLPSAPHLLGLASELEIQRDHVLGRRVEDEDDLYAAEQDLLAREQAAEQASGEELLMPFQALGSEARVRPGALRRWRVRPRR